MVPNDDPLGGGQPNENPTPKPEPTPAPAAPAPDNSPMMQELASTMRQMQEAITNLNDRIERASQQPQEPVLPPSADEFTQQLFSTPQEAIQGEIRRATAPVVSQLAEQVAEQNLNEVRQRIDNEWGMGAFDKILDPQLRPIIDEAKRLNPQGLLNRRAIFDAVDTFIGRNVSKLLEHKEDYFKSNSAQEEEATARLRDTILADVTPNLTGGIRRGGPVPTQLSDEQRAIAREMAKADGIPRDEKRLAAMQATEIRTLEDYKRFQDSLKKDQQ